MIALVTSTLYPGNRTIDGVNLSRFSSSERIDQTHQTIRSLHAAGISSVYLADNSGAEFHDLVARAFPSVTVKTFDTYQFTNRGYSEALLVLNALKYLPEETPILKISGRYRLTPVFEMPNLDDADVAVRGYDFQRRNGSVSTRCYAVRNKAILERLMLRVLIDIDSYHLRIVGPRSAFNASARLRGYGSIERSTRSIEGALAAILKDSDLKVTLWATIGLEGHVAGPGASPELLSE